MVAQFGQLRARLVELNGEQKGRGEYYRVLGDFGCRHANQFKSAAIARRAYRVLAATREQWESRMPQPDEERATEEVPLFDVKPQTTDQAANGQELNRHAEAGQ